MHFPTKPTFSYGDPSPSPTPPPRFKFTDLIHCDRSETLFYLSSEKNVCSPELTNCACEVTLNTNSLSLRDNLVKKFGDHSRESVDIGLKKQSCGHLVKRPIIVATTSPSLLISKATFTDRIWECGYQTFLRCSQFIWEENDTTDRLSIQYQLPIDCQQKTKELSEELELVRQENSRFVNQLQTIMRSNHLFVYLASNLLRSF